VSSGVSACGFAAAEVFAGLAGRAELAPWLRLSPRRCRVRASGLAGSRTGRSPAGDAGAGGVLDAGAREPMIEACGERLLPRSGSCVYAVVVTPRPAVRPGSPLAAFIPSLVPGTAGRGAWGGFASGPGGANQTGARAAGPGRTCRRPWQGAEYSAASRPVAGGRIAGGRAPGRRAVMRPGGPAAGPGGGRARPACRRRPGSAARGPRRSWRCSWPPCRGGR
jgi:hypothetical protein